MKSPIRLALLAAFIAAVALGGVTGLLIVTRGTTTTESATTILRKSEAAQAQLLAPLGPNTTYHARTVQHLEHTVTEMSGYTAPNDTTTDLFMAFDSAGMMNTFWQVSRGPDGQVVERGDWSDGKLVFTNTKTGKVTAQVGYGRFSATELSDRLSQTITKVIQAASSASTAKGMVAGIPAYVIETPTNRTYIGRSDYRVLKSEQLAPDGHVTEYTMQTTQEVLPGIATDTTPLPDAGSCCSLQLDMDPTTAGVQAARSVNGPQDISIDIVLGDNIGTLGSFNFKLIYDDTRLSPAGATRNPAINAAALGSGWTCTLPATSGQPDIDPATGAGHGVALLSCFNTQGVTLSTPTVLATLRLHVNASGPSTVTLADAQIGNDQGAELGSCEPVYAREMTCVGGSVTAP